MAKYKHIVNEQGKTKHESSRSVIYRATQYKYNIGTIAFERSEVYTTEWLWGGGRGGLKAFHWTNFTLDAKTILTKNQIDHCDETKNEYSWLIPHCKPELKETTSWTTVQLLDNSLRKWVKQFQVYNSRSSAFISKYQWPKVTEYVPINILFVRSVIISWTTDVM